MQQELDRLRSQTERNAHRFVQMWTGKSVEAAFGGWVTVVAQSKLTRAKAERFAAVRTTRGVRRVLRAFRENGRRSAHARDAGACAGAVAKFAPLPHVRRLD